MRHGQRKSPVLISLEHRAAICVNVTMMLRCAHRMESEVIANNPTCGKGRAELTTRNGSVTLSHERKKGRNTDITRDRKVVNARVSLTHRSVEKRKPTFRVPAETSSYFGQLCGSTSYCRFSFKRNREQSDVRKQHVTVVDDMLTLFASRCDQTAPTFK